MTVVWSYWTEEEIESLRQLWVKGHTGAEIASMLGKSRNAVMGRISRMRERGERLPSERERKPPKPKIAKIPRIRKTKIKTIVLSPKTTKRVEYVSVEYDPNKKYPKFKELGKWQCKYVMNDGHPSQYVFCGAETNFESFCPSHKQLCYTKAVKNDAPVKPANSTNYAKRKFFGAFSH